MKQEIMKQSVLVSGGAGYVGSVLVPKLINKDYDVSVLDLMIFGDEGVKNVSDKCNIIKGDIRDSEALKKAVEGIDLVIHLAAISNDPCSDLNPKLTQEVNYDAVVNLVKLAKNAGVKRFINASSSSVYGIKEEDNVTEDLTLEPLTLYSRLKAETEKVILSESSKDFITTSIRSATVCGYSPRQRLDVIVNIFAHSAFSKKQITVNGGNQKRPNIHIDDITDLYLNLLTKSEQLINGQIFNYGEINHTASELGEIVKAVFGDSVSLVYGPQTKDSRSYSISSEKIKQELGYAPKKTIAEAVLDLKNVFESGILGDLSQSKYKNVARMKEIDLE